MTAVPPGLVAMVQDRVRVGATIRSSHARAHGREQGFGVAQIRAAVLTGVVIDWMAERQRLLFCARVRNREGRLVWLHVVVDYVHPIKAGVVTAYVPDPAEWEEPPLRRRR
jgi:hypothetical protein